MKVVERFYPASVLGGIDSIIQVCMSSESISPFTVNAVNYLTELFPQAPYGYYPEDAFRCIWKNLIRFQRKGKIDWIKAYWEYAVSYANYSLHTSDISDNVKKLRFRFQEFHHVFCAFLLYAGEYSLVKHLMNYSTSSDGTNSLRPDNVNEIINHLKPFDQLSCDPFHIERNYSFHLNNGVRESEVVYGWLECFYIIRIIQTKNQVPINRNKSIKELLNDVDLCKNILGMLNNGSIWEQLSSSEDFKKAFCINEKEIDNCKSFMDSYISELEEEIKSKREAIEPEENLKEEFVRKVNESVMAELKRVNFPYIETEWIEGNYDSHPLPENSCSKEYFTSDPSISYLYFPETYTSLCLQNIYCLYEKNFPFTSEVKSYVINYNEIDEALIRLQLDSRFALISFGADISKVRDVPILENNRYYVKSGLRKIIILKADECPKLLLSNPIVSIGFKNTDPPSDEVVVEGIVKYLYEEATKKTDQDSAIERCISLQLEYQNSEGIKSALPDIKPISSFIDLREEP